MLIMNFLGNCLLHRSTCNVTGVFLSVPVDEDWVLHVLVAENVYTNFHIYPATVRNILFMSPRFGYFCKDELTLEHTFRNV